MARKGFLRKFKERITSPVKRATAAVGSAVSKTASTVSKTAAAPFSKKKRAAKKEPAAPVPKPRPTPAVAREQLAAKLHDMYWLQKKWDAAATNKRINKMTDAQVYAALDLSENDIESAVRMNPREHPEWAAPDDPNANIMYYHGGEVTIV